MKLRFHGEGLRLRLSQSEVVRLAETGRVEETVTFRPGQTLTYTLETAGVTAIFAGFDQGQILVRLPLLMARNWAASEQVGIQGDSGPLHVLIEKDFQCLHQGAEAQADAFPNPPAGEF